MIYEDTLILRVSCKTDLTVVHPHLLSELKAVVYDVCLIGIVMQVWNKVQSGWGRLTLWTLWMAWNSNLTFRLCPSLYTLYVNCPIVSLTTNKVFNQAYLCLPSLDEVNTVSDKQILPSILHWPIMKTADYFYVTKLCVKLNWWFTCRTFMAFIIEQFDIWEG